MRNNYMPEDNLKYKKILLKLSGEAFAGEKGLGIDDEIVSKISDKIIEITKLGVQVSVVVGGGNFWRGRQNGQIERTTSDYMGMLATTLNALALQATLEKKGAQTRVQTAIEMREVAEPYIRRKAVKHLDKGRIVIFACGTGNPYFSTDTAAALRAAEVGAEVILLAKTIDGVYTADPKEDKNATKFDEISYLDVLTKNLKVLDSTATSLCRDNKIPLIVFAINEPENIVKIIKGENIGTKIN